MILGVPLGLLMGVNRRASGGCNYIVQFLRPLPPLSYFILLIVWFGTGNLSKVLLLFLTAFPVVASAAMAGVRGVPRLRIQAAEMLGAAPRQIFFQVIMPSAAPMIFTGLKMYYGEQYPTRLRATGSSTVESISRLLGGVVGPYFVPMALLSIGLSGLFRGIAIVAIIGPIVVWIWGKETAKQTLEEMSVAAAMR
ncbi:MAG: ABC transporter permease subunit [Acetobacteraceae bacterium]